MIDTLLHKWLRVPHLLYVGNDIKPKDTKVTVVFVHGLANSHGMWRPLIKRVAKDHVRVMTVDLLGFGDSPKPVWQTYSAKTHAKSLHLTLRARGVRGPVIVVGHSLGSLVAVQYAAQHPRSVHSLVLCSPPLYRPPKATPEKTLLPQPDDVYRQFYSYTRNNPDLAKKLALLIKKARLLDPNFRVDDETIPAIVSSLEMSIENQTSLADAKKLKLPIHVIYGKLDPFIIKRNIRELVSNSQNALLETLIAGHEIGLSKQFKDAVVHTVKDMAQDVIQARSDLPKRSTRS